ncbi:MAG TPA: DNA methyltransferase [Syntrophaceticus sp.]|nr:DNA methyltransferase [Syntrophaceticus sp.]
MSDNNNHIPASIVSKIWSFCHILRDDGVSYGDYLEQITYLLFLKMADEYAKPPYNREIGIPGEYSWEKLFPGYTAAWHIHRPFSKTTNK